MKRARELLSLIRDIPGKKIVTLTLLVEEDTSDFVFDVSAKGRVGYHRDHRNQLLTLLDYAIQNSGGIVIRRFTPLSYQGKNTRGEPMLLPYKAIYAAFLGNGDYFPLNKSETEDICCTDASTGLRTKREEGVIYRDWDITRHALVQ